MISPQYLAGFFDGEGTISLLLSLKKGTDKKYPHAVVLLSQSGEDGLALLELIQTKYGGKIYMHLAAGQHKATKNAYKLYWNKAEAITLLKAIKPYLVLKEQQAKTVLEYLTR